MSAILGTKHEWQRGRTVASDWDYERRYTAYTCAKCGAAFDHAYNLEPNIYAAMEQAGVPLECSGPA